MMTSRSFRRSKGAIGMAAVALVGLSACGGGDSDGDATSGGGAGGDAIDCSVYEEFGDLDGKKVTIYTSIITLGSQQTKVASPKLVNFVLTCGTIGTMLTFVVTGPIVAASGPLAALHTANGLYAVVFVMCFILGFVSRHRQNNAQAASH